MILEATGIARKKQARRLSAAGVITVLFAAWLVCGGWFWNDPVKVVSTQILMDTSVNVQVFAKNRKTGERLIAEAFREARRIESIMEPRKGGGELDAINKSGETAWKISPELQTVLRETFRINALSGGAFDPTIAPVKWLWNFDDGGDVPPESAIEEKLRFVGMSGVGLRGDSLFFDNPEVKLDLGGVAKGYVVDCMIDVLRRGGAKAVLVNAGGDIAMFGKKPGGKDWVIGIRHPRLNRTLVVDTVKYATVATSGDYERYFMRDGIRYHHILDPETGRPARGCISVTVWSQSAMLSDILSTTIFVLGPDRGVGLAESMDDVEALVFFEDNGAVRAVMSSGIKGKVRM
ncbi:MAG: FAD:protein FMN transferase [Candidatus Latescibacteria bacterium]|nr:FAD:protein FMN transferase [Candidatus Latescibacterota bacterium]